MTAPRGVAMPVISNKKIDTKAKRKKMMKEFKIDEELHSEYALNLMLQHYENDRKDLVEMVKDGYLNRAMRRAKVKAPKNARMTKADLINYMKMIQAMENASNNSK